MIFLIALAYLLIIIEAIGLVYLFIEYRAMIKSTHKIQYVNLAGDGFQKMTDEMKKKLSEDPYDNIV